MKRKFISLLVILSVTILIVGCEVTSSRAYTFSIETGDSVEVSLDTTDDYGLTSDLPFVISQEDQTLTQGTFIHGEYYAEYVDIVDVDEDATLLDSGQKDGNDYVFWSYDDTEYNYAVLIGESNTGLILSNTVSEETAKEVFERLTLSLKN